jgi:hypothetical protein
MKLQWRMNSINQIGVRKMTVSDKTTKADSTPATKTESSDAAPSRYSRGEGQKPVSQAYRDNWNAIYGKKTSKMTKAKKKR